MNLQLEANLRAANDNISSGERKSTGSFALSADSYIGRLVEHQVFQRKVFDCFLYNGEVDVLEIRLRELAEVVHRFVVVESDTTFSGLRKRLKFDPFDARLTPFADAIRYVVVSDTPHTEDPWQREAWQRNAVLRGVPDAAEDDIVMVSDVDEIPRATSVQQIVQDGVSRIFGLQLALYYFFVDYRNVAGPESAVTCSVAAKRSEFENILPNNLRLDVRCSRVAARILRRAGWHFSYLMDEAGIRRKICAFSHQEFNHEDFLRSISIAATVSRRGDLFNRPGYQWEIVDSNELPSWLQANRSALSRLFSTAQFDAIDFQSELSRRSEHILALEHELASREQRTSELEGELDQRTAELCSQSKRSGEKIDRLEKQLRSQAAQSGEKVDRLEKQLRSQAAQSGEKVDRLEKQLRSQAAQSGEKVRRLEEQVSQLDLTRSEAEHLCHSITTSLSWKLTSPLRVLRDGIARAFKKIKRRDNLPVQSARGEPSKTDIRINPTLPLENVPGFSNARCETDPAGELLLTIFDAAHYLKQVPSAAGSLTAALEHYRTIGWRQGRDPHPLFDVDWYLSENRDVAEAGAEPLQHYLERGWKEGRNPHPLFDLKRYLAENADVAQAGVEPLNQYCKNGWREGRDPHPLFDVDWYLSENRDVAEAGSEPLGQYLGPGWKERRNPHPLFDVQWYLERNPDVEAAGVEPLGHYKESGWKEGRSPHPLFDIRWYLERNPDVEAAGVEPLGHYKKSGWKEGRSPHPLFDIRWYLERNSDVEAAGIEPLSHYIESGWKEGRSPHPLFDAKSYLEQNPAAVASNIEPLQYYLDRGWKDQPDAHPLHPHFDAGWYLQQNPEIEKAGVGPLRHYISIGWREGLCSSPLFDSAWYLKAYQDVAKAGFEPLTHYLQHGISEGRFPRSIDRELAELPDQNFGRWANEHCTWFLSQVSENEFNAPLRKKAIKDLTEALVSTRVEKLPEVSIVVAAHNKLDFTLLSVTAVLRSNPRRAFEIIVADDASTDETRSIFENLPNPVRYVGWDQNQGFLRSCNAAAQSALGRHLVFLNNDTIVFPGWLDSLIDTLEEQPNAGLVGSKLLFANGRLQEAGGIIWSDGSGMNFGRNDDPGHPRYNYLRQVDYCSGCSLAISKELWSVLGGFDERFAPAYYEDADLCFRARQRGKRIFYHPFSKLIHFEGISSGTSTSSGVKAYQELNRLQFLDRWSDTLQSHGNQDELPRVADRYARGHVLVVDAVIPTPDQDAGSVATFNFLRILKRLNKRVTFVPSDLNRLQHYASQLEAIGVECLCHPTFSSLQDAISYAGPEIQFAFLHRVGVAGLIIDFVKRTAPRAKVIFNTIDLHFLRERREADLFGGKWRQDRAKRTKLDELEVIRKADATIVLNDSERVLLSELVPTASVIQIGLVGVPNEDPLVETITWDARRDIVFVGGFRHAPNCDAVRYFVFEVWPILREMGYRDRFVIVGSKMPREIESLGSDRIIAKGYVEDLTKVFAAVRVSVAPLRFGAGLKGKVAASLGYGVPCVTTSIGVEGSGLLDGVNVLVGDTPHELASHILHAYNDSQMWTKLSQNGLHFFRGNYSLEAIGAKIENMMTVLTSDNLELHTLPCSAE
jgi:GT2 family glycosyltransferase/ubiquinone biosynthesis protein Coq4